jgi:diaminopimelate decarboxylase
MSESSIKGLPPGSPSTPFYLVDLETLQRECQRLMAAATCEFAYSVKTLPVREALEVARSLNWAVEVVSEEEYAFAIECGVGGSEIIVNGPAKAPGLIRLAIQNSSYLHVDSLDELAYADVTDSARLRTGVRLGHGVVEEAWSRFGIDVAEPQLRRRLWSALRDHPAIGFHVHCGSNRQQLEPFIEVVDRAATIAREASVHGLNVAWIDLGGGLPDSKTPQKQSSTAPPPDAAAFVSAASRRIQSAWEQETSRPCPMLIFEPGRSVVAAAADLYVRVLDVKMVGGKQIVFLDAGVNSLPLARVYKYDIEVLDRDCDSEDHISTVVSGPLCAADDAIAKVELPRLRCGDVVRIRRIGAYNISMGYHFIRRRAPVYVYDGQSCSPSRLMFD